MESLDLDIDNYDLLDILKLLKYNITLQNKILKMLKNLY